MNTLRCRDANWLCSAAGVVLALLMFSSASQASDVRQLWQSRDQFVALERQDGSTANPAQPNDHPADLTLDRLTAILESIEIRTADGGKPEPLFTRPAVQALAPQLQQALHQASPREDVTFAIIGLYNAMYGLAKGPKVTTGRVFYKGGRLNIIFGLVQQDVNDRDDRRLSPFTPGSRQKTSKGEWALLPQPGQNGYNLVRKDWVTFGDEWQTAVSQTPAIEKNAPPEKHRDMRSPTERLIILNDLKNKGLISEEEYRGKRLEILNGL